MRDIDVANMILGLKLSKLVDAVLISRSHYIEKTLRDLNILNVDL